MNFNIIRDVQGFTIDQHLQEKEGSQEAWHYTVKADSYLVGELVSQEPLFDEDIHDFNGEVSVRLSTEADDVNTTIEVWAPTLFGGWFPDLDWALADTHKIHQQRTIREAVGILVAAAKEQGKIREENPSSTYTLRLKQLVGMPDEEAIKFAYDGNTFSETFQPPLRLYEALEGVGVEHGEVMGEADVWRLNRAVMKVRPLLGDKAGVPHVIGLDSILSLPNEEHTLPTVISSSGHALSEFLAKSLYRSSIAERRDE